ncbi:MAG: DsbA family protein [Ferruginibacter sp.]
MFNIGEKLTPAAHPPQADLLEIIYYTDPLCCWSWGFEPQWRKLLYEYSGQIKYRYCMGGLLPGWNNYMDAVNSVSKPIQMVPVWMHAAQLSGMPMKHNLWVTDPPASSYPACIAVKCAGLQSKEAEEWYLRMLRQALMIEGKNISKEIVLAELAKELQSIDDSFNYQMFMEDLKNGRGKEAFRIDLQEVQYHRIQRFPSLVIKNRSNQAIIVEGYRNYSSLIDAIKQVANLEKTHQNTNLTAYKELWPLTTDREIAEL